MIPSRVSHFLRGTVRTTWALDVLQIMSRRPGEAWSVEALTAEIRGSRTLVTGILAAFAARNLVMEQPEGHWRYCASAEQDGLVKELLAVYTERPVQVISEIALSPNDKLFTFVDAFRLKQD